MSQRLADKVSVITGSTSGLGAATARRFAAEGARVVVSGRSAERGEKVVDEIRKGGGDAIFLACDLGDEASVKGLIERAVAHYGRIDNLIANAAATATMGGEKNAGILEMDNALLEQSISTNVRGLLWLLKHALPRWSPPRSPPSARRARSSRSGPRARATGRRACRSTSRPRRPSRSWSARSLRSSVGEASGSTASPRASSRPTPRCGR
ncbi:MAG: SDR family NAD(P)-dependent oxidoreductase [Deltaproteobacteria bacterium]|nr:SDR family NAD(P)-dependent oxidoreductase [Deltaproteobacteria bacterium]